MMIVGVPWIAVARPLAEVRHIRRVDERARAGAGVLRVHTRRSREHAARSDDTKAAITSRVTALCTGGVRPHAAERDGHRGRPKVVPAAQREGMFLNEHRPCGKGTLRHAGTATELRVLPLVGAVVTHHDVDDTADCIGAIECRALWPANDLDSLDRVRTQLG